MSAVLTSADAMYAPDCLDSPTRLKRALLNLLEVVDNGPKAGDYRDNSDRAIYSHWHNNPQTSRPPQALPYKLAMQSSTLPRAFSLDRPKTCCIGCTQHSPVVYGRDDSRYDRTNLHASRASKYLFAAYPSQRVTQHNPPPQRGRVAAEHSSAGDFDSHNEDKSDDDVMAGEEDNDIESTRDGNQTDEGDTNNLKWDAPNRSGKNLKISRHWICEMNSCGKVFPREGDLKRHQRFSKFHTESSL